MFAAKAAPATVEEQARGLAEALLGSYPVPLAPRSAPDLARGAKLYAENCAMCHGATGAGNGPGAAGLDPPPIAFTDAARARERSLRSEEHTSELQSLMRTSSAVFCLQKPNPHQHKQTHYEHSPKTQAMYT